MDPKQLTERLKNAARDLGFDLVGVCPAVTPPGFNRYREWLAAGFAGEMHYLVERESAYEHPSSILEGVRSVVMLAMNYNHQTPIAAQPGEGRVSRYAWGEADYHDVIHGRLKQLTRLVRDWDPTASVRGVIDTAPLLEREFAQLAGLGWIGKNTLLINKSFGSWFFLAAVLTDLTLVYDAPHQTDHCGTCRACLDACPTDAFPQAYVLDATKCISYLTIELRDQIPESMRAGIGDWVFGCDVCQDVCPWNNRVPPSKESTFRAREEQNPLSLAELFYLTDEQFRARFRKTPLWRPKRRGILRNAAIVLGNQRATVAIAALTHGLDDPEPLVQEACHWALERIKHS
ncbi:MAG: tRNA epoxyqueuosine(34) reductase QueG [Planctomycetaceae bacterium]|nr:tRNA epoxyqueuosine(34) reductase QueG [Planctomycetales bacterium]MCB9925702.1 tRNA epoxyqueuosine(34) reductase QueG [Planctomycetaceae bacterium]